VPVDRLGDWAFLELPRLNRAVLAGELPPAAVVGTLADQVLVDLPSPESVDPAQARQLLVHLGFCGAAVARHYQEEDPARKATPERAFDPLPVGPQRIPFRGYFARLADRTGTGHPGRDSYALVVRWNVPTVAVHWHGARLAVLPGVFADGRVRTYTGDLGERRFFELIKKCEALERAVNDLLEPISDGSVGLETAEATERTRLAATLLTAVRQLISDFGSLPAGEGMTAEHFIDVFRQFAGHWEVGDIPPSGALDPEALKRDLLLGLPIPDRDKHVLRLFPGLLEAERAELTRLMDRPPVPDALLAALRLDPDTLRGMPATELRDAVRRHPALVAWYLVLTAHARTSGLHLAVTKKMLFRTARERDLAGIPDTGIVPRRYGTTGMDESLLERLVRARHNHVLAALGHVPRLELLALAGIEEPDVVPGPDLDTLVGLVDAPDPGDRRDPLVLR
jgi:hypothetical protein